MWTRHRMQTRLRIKLKSTNIQCFASREKRKGKVTETSSHTLTNNTFLFFHPPFLSPHSFPFSLLSHFPFFFFLLLLFPLFPLLIILHVLFYSLPSFPPRPCVWLALIPSSLVAGQLILSLCIAVIKTTQIALLRVVVVHVILGGVLTGRRSVWGERCTHF